MTRCRGLVGESIGFDRHVRLLDDAILDAQERFDFMRVPLGDGEIRRKRMESEISS